MSVTPGPTREQKILVFFQKRAIDLQSDSEVDLQRAINDGRVLSLFSRGRISPRQIKGLTFKVDDRGI